MKDLRTFMEELEEAGELKRVKAEVDWNLELSHVAKLNEERGGPALLFENVKGYRIPVLASSLTTTRRLALAMDAPGCTSLTELAREWVKRCEKPVPLKWVQTGPCKENVLKGDQVNLYDFPAPWFYPGDGGRYIGTAHAVITQDPETGWINLGTYRMQLLDEKSAGIMMVEAKHGDLHRRKWHEMGKPMPVVVVIGYHPCLFLASSTFFGPGVSEYDYLGALMGEPVEVVRAETCDLPVPAGAEIVLEGLMWPDRMKPEGPFGEYTGYYSGKGTTPRHYVDVQCVTFRNQPVFHCTTVGRAVTDTHMIQSLNRTATLWQELENMKIPGIQSVYCPPEAGGRFMAIVSVKQMYPGHSNHVADAVFASYTGSYGMKICIVVDDDIPADDIPRVLWALSQRYQPSRGTQIYRRGRSTPLDPSLPIEERRLTSRIALDACIPYEWEKKPRLVELSREMVEKVRARWSEYGID